MAKNPEKPDYILFFLISMIMAFGVVILASVSAPYSEVKFHSTSYFLRHQLLYGLLPGLFLGFIAYRTSLSFFKRVAPLLFLLNLVLMILVFFPVIGSNQFGASRWLNLGPFSFQPGELLKLSFILYLASWLSARTPEENTLKPKTRQDLKGSIKVLLFFMLIIGVIAVLLYMQPNVSTLGIISLVAFLMYFLAKTPWWHTLGLVSMGFAGLFILMKIAPYRADRLLVFLKPDSDPMGIGYQAKQALFAIGSGGKGGVGLGMSVQKLGFLPQTIGDSIFAVFSEETGFIGAFLLISLFLLFLFRGFKVAKDAPNKFSQLAAAGITSWIVIQSFVNIGAMIGLLPLTGIPLPFISYGGSALIIELIGMGVLLNISKQRV